MRNFRISSVFLGLLATYCMNFLQTIEKPLILAVNVVRVLFGCELKVHRMVCLVFAQAFLI